LSVSKTPINPGGTGNGKKMCNMRETGFERQLRVTRQEQDQDQDQAQFAVCQDSIERQGNQGAGMHQVPKVRQSKKGSKYF
jgi:hypothetical protein